MLTWCLIMVLSSQSNALLLDDTFPSQQECEVRKRVALELAYRKGAVRATAYCVTKVIKKEL
jgi:hypothetical protein